jgi:hypothetical protein
MIMHSAKTGVFGSNVLLRIDDVGLKGFAEARSIYALVPADDPGLAHFEAARKALDRGMQRALPTSAPSAAECCNKRLRSCPLATNGSIRWIGKPECGQLTLAARLV